MMKLLQLLFLIVVPLTVQSFTVSMPTHNRWKKSTTAVALKPVASMSTNSSPKPVATASTTSSSNKEAAANEASNGWKLPTILPKIIIFDLDNTLWTPELYQIRQRQCPTPGKEISLFSDVPAILRMLKSKNSNSTILAIASRTNKGEWARQLLQDFNLDGTSLDRIFPKQEIFTGSKKEHMSNLKKKTGVDYNEMVFFDDDERLNLKEISQQLGMLCGHCPKGMTMALFQRTMDRYADMAQDDESSWRGEIIKAHAAPPKGAIVSGTVDFYNPAKRFGFVNDKFGEKYFFHESKVADGITVKKGMRVTFETMMDNQGRPAAAIMGAASGSSTSASTDTSNSVEMPCVEMPCFTMSQPFASLLLHGIKTVESRNNDMFASLPAGTKLLLQAGRKDWHDTESYKEILRTKHDMTNDEIAKLSKLPNKFEKGQVLGVVTIGKTTQTASPAERKRLQRQVVAPTDGIGKFCTEIVDAQWLPKDGIPMRGQPGIYTVRIPKSALPQ
jgi:magnesium-dependent phosphatase 1